MVAIRSVGFSSRGTLVATAEGLVNASEPRLRSGRSLMPLLGLGPKMCCRSWPGRKDFAALGLEIAMSSALRRGAFVNLQIASRRVWEAQPSVSKSIAAQDVLPDELKAAIILFFSLLD